MENNNNVLDGIESMLVKEIEWYLTDDVPLKEKQAKLSTSLAANKMISNVIIIETMKQRERVIANATNDIERKIDRFGVKK